MHENKHISDLKTTINFMTEIKNRTMQFMLPFDSIIRYCSENGCYTDISEKYLSLKMLSPPDAWKTAVKNGKMCLNSAEKSLLTDFGCMLCSCSREQIAVNSDRFINEMTSDYLIVKEKREKNTKLIPVLSLTISLAVIMVLV